MQPLPLGIKVLTWGAWFFVLAAQLHMVYWAARLLRARSPRWGVWAALALLVVTVALTGASDLFKVDRFFFGPGRAPSQWRLAASVWVAGSLGAYLLLLVRQGWNRYSLSRSSRPSEAGESDADRTQMDPSRRQLVSSLASAAIVAPFAAAAYGTFIGRKQFEVREVELSFPGLPESLDGFRIVQLSDIHFGPYLPASDLERVVGMANETKAHLAVVTGDLITRETDPLERCLDILADLKADAGVYGCCGNHETYTRSEALATEYARGHGMQFLRQRSLPLRIGGATLNLCGVDYQRKKWPYLIGAEKMLDPQAFNVLLTHNPDVFPVAADMGYDLLIAGHTHGGQVTVEIVEQWVNAGLFFTPFVVGEYRLADSALYVSRGIGTINLPMRIGALPEITLLRLQRA